MTLRIAGQSIEIFRGLTLGGRRVRGLLLAAIASATLAAAQGPVFLPTVITIAGNQTAGYTGDGGPATAATLSNGISGSTIDPAGNIYIADTNNSVIRKVDARTGIITTFAGTGVGGYNGDGILATQAEIFHPQAVRYHQGGLWIVDSANNRIRRIDLAKLDIETIVGGGTNSLKNATDGDNYQGTSISVPTPQDIAFDSLGNMYWSQGGGTSRVDVINLSTGVAHLFAGTGGTATATGTNGPTANCALTLPECTILNGPFGIAVDAQNNVYVDETATHVIRKITVGAVTNISTYAGIGIAPGAAVCANAKDAVGDGCPAASANFGTVSHFSIDGKGTIYLADSTNNLVRVIPTSSDPTVGGVVSTLEGTGAAASSPDGSYPQATAVGSPWDAQILPSGDLLVAERTSNIMRLLHLPGAFPQTALGASSPSYNVLALTQAATGSFSLPGSTDFTGAGAPACSAGVNVTGTVCATTVTFSPTVVGLRTSAVEFTDSNGSVIAGVSGVGLGPAASLLPGLMSTVAGTGTAAATGDGGAAVSAALNMPGGVVVGSHGSLYIADTANNEVRKVTPDGTITRIAGTGAMGSAGDGGAATSATLNAPAGIAVDAAGNVYIADTGNNKIRVVDAVSGNISTLSGNGTAGYTGDLGVPANAQLNAPTQLAWSQSGILYVADTGNSAVRSIALGAPQIVTVAGSANAGFDGDTGPGEAALLQNPEGVAVDGAGNVYIADTGNNRIRVLTEGNISTIAGQSGGGFLGDGTASATELDAPAGLAVDSAGTLYIADTKNQRVRVIFGGEIATVAGTGTAGATGDGGTSALATVSSPLGVAIDRSGNLVIADTGNNKIRGVNVATNALTFKTLNPMETSPVQTVSLFNSGNQPLTLNSVSAVAGYMEEASTSGVDCTSAPLTLATGSSCNLNTVFSPPTVGPYDGTITLSDNAQGVATATQTISVTGTSAFVFTAALTLPSAATAGSAVSGLLTVKNPSATYTGTVKFTSTDPQATLPANFTFGTADAGTHTISVTFKTAGPQCVTVTDTTDATVTATACTAVSAAAAAKIAVHSGNNQTTNVSTAFTQRLIASVTDAYGNPVQTAPVTFTISTGGAASGTFTNGTNIDMEKTDLSGFATAATITPGATIGTLTVTASLPGTSSSVNFSLVVSVLGSFTIVPDSATVGPVSPAESAPVNLTIVPSGGFSDPVVLTCTAPASTSCSVSPTTDTFTNGVPSFRPILIFQGEGGLRGAGLVHGWWMAIGGLLAMLAFGRRRRWSVVLMAMVALFAIGSMSGCGQMYAPTTASGTYMVTVTGTSQNVSASTTVTFTVQK